MNLHTEAFGIYTQGREIERRRKEEEREESLLTLSFSSFIHHLPGANMRVATALKITVYTDIDAYIYRSTHTDTYTDAKTYTYTYTCSCRCLLISHEKAVWNTYFP